MDNTKHFSAEQLVDFLEDRLDTPSRTELLNHLKSGCQVCNTSMAFYKRLFSAIHSLHWLSPSASAHNNALRAFSAKYPVKTKNRPLSILRPVFISFTILAIIVFAFLFNLNPRVVYAGHIENSSGLVEILDVSTGTWKPVKTGQAVPVKSSIRTMSEATATITFPGGEQTILGADSEVQLLSLAKTQGAWEISLELVSGQSEHQTSQKTHSFSVRTSAGVANSSNGQFAMNISPDGSVVTSVLEGNVEIRSHDQNSIIHPGETYVLTPVETDEPTVSSTLIDETQMVPSQNPTPEPSQTSTPVVEPTKTPKDQGKPTRTPTLTGTLPTQLNKTENSVPTNSSSNSNNADITCSPGNSNGAGNSENASNSSNACK
jgi:hypothetical protein